MAVSMVVRVDVSALREGRLEGEAEHVSSGTSRPITGAADLIALAQEAVDERVNPTRSA